MKINFVLAAACVFLAGCPVMEAPKAIGASGTIRLTDTIAKSGYPLVKLHVYTKPGKLISSTVPMAEEDYFVWEMNLEKPEGTEVTFWVEFLDRTTGIVLFSQAQDDVISLSNRYDWLISELYIPIFSEKELRLIGNDTHFPVNRRFVLVTDLALSETWIPICEESNPFTGTFEGNGRTISGLKLFSGGNQNIGLFACLKNGAKVRNLNLVVENAALTLTALHTQNVGFLAGSAEHSEISKITVNIRPSGGNPVALSISKASGTLFNVGGIVGSLSGTSKIDQSASLVPLAVSMGYQGSTSTIFCGGIAGKVSGTGGIKGYIDIVKCYVPSDISASFINSSLEPGSQIFIGGIAGGAPADRTELVIEESFFGGNISTQDSWSGSIGGLFGGGALDGAVSMLVIKRSVSLANRINASFREPPPISPQLPSFAIDRVAGQPLMTAAEDFYAAVPMQFGGMPQQIAPVSGTDKAGTGADEVRSSINVAWFGNQAAYGGLAWNFNNTWTWSNIRNYPVFQWQKL